MVIAVSRAKRLRSMPPATTAGEQQQGNQRVSDIAFA